MEFNETSNWIYLKDDNGDIIAEITFPKVDDETVNIDHTYVDNSLRGQGIAGKLTEAAYESIKKQGKKCTLTCPYAIKWFDEHPEKKDIVLD